MAGGKARAAAGAKGGAGGAKTAGKPRPKAKPKPRIPGAAHSRRETVHAAAAPAPCACGGDCPRCGARAAARRANAPQPKTAQASRPPPDAAEREARILGRRLSLIGEPAADAPRPAAAPHRAPAPTGGPEAAGAKATPAALPRRRPRLRETRAPHPGLTRARRLSRAERRAGEEALGLDLDAVRIHTGPVAHALAEQAGAFAFTHGNHIVLGGRAERASPAARSRILAHELIHVVQQAAPPLPAPPRHQWPEARGPPLRPRIRAPPQMQCLSLEDLGGYADAAVNTVVDYGSDAVDGVVEFAEDVGDATLDAVRATVDFLAPGLWDFLSGGALEDMADLLCQGVDLVLGTVFDGISDIDIMTTLEQTFEGLAKGVNDAKSSVTTAVRSAVGTLFKPFVKALEKWGGPLISWIQKLTGAVSGVFNSAWDNVAVPALDLLEAAGGAVWETFTGFITWLWDLIAPLRNTAEWAWGRVTAFFDIAWNSTSDIRETLADFASEAFDSFLELIEPIKTPLMVAGGILLLISPLGPIIVATQVIPPLYEKITWLVENWDKTEIVVEARKYLHDTILPGIMGLIDGVKSALVGAAVWLAEVLGRLATGMVRVVSAFSGNRCMKAVNRIIDHIDDQVTRFQDWANSGFKGLNEALGAALDALKALFQPIQEFLVRLLVVVGNPFMLPIAITGVIWLLLPDELKPPVINFVLGLILAAVEAMPTFLPGLFPLAALMKAGVIGFLKHLQGDGGGEGAVDDDQRVAATNKIANLATGGGVQFIAGFVVGILTGLIEGIIDPFKLLFMLFELVIKGIVVVSRIYSRLVELVSPWAAAQVQSAVRQVVGPPPPGQTEAPADQPQPEAAAAPQTAEIGETAEYGADLQQAANAGGPPAPEPAAAADYAAEQQVGREIRHIRPAYAQSRQPGGTSVGAGRTVVSEITSAGPATQGPAANDNAPSGGTASTPEAEQTYGAAAQGGVAGAQAGGAGGGEDVALESELTDEQIIAYMSPAVLQGGATPAVEEDLTAESLEQDMRGEVDASGSSVAGLAGLLGDAWDALMGGAARIGGMAAGWLMEFLALPDYDLGNKLGWLTGMILLELLIAYFTAGGYMVIKEGAGIGARLLAYFLRFLDMGGAILGVMGKGLARLRGPIMGGLDVASGFLSRFRFLDGIMGRIRGAADWLFTFGDEIGRAADEAWHGVDDVAGRGVMGLADDTAQGVARGADEVPGLSARAADEVPAAPIRSADEGLPGGARAADEAPAAPARAADEVPAAAPARQAEAPVGTARQADEAADAGADRAARDAMDEAGGRPPRGGLDEAADGSRRTADDVPPTIRDEALRATEFPQAILAARQIAEFNDAADQPIPIVMGALMALKTRYRWIDYFIARPLSGRGVYRIAMVASPETPVDRRYTIYETPGTPPARAAAADRNAWRAPPQNGRVVAEGDSYVVYELPDGTQRIRFDAREARTLTEARQGRNQTREAGAGLSPDDRPYVHEGRHRSIGAAKGDIIAEGNGGVPGHPEILDFPFNPNPAPSSGRNVRDLTIDYDVPEMDPHTLRDFDEARELGFTDPQARRMSPADREIASPRRGREIGEDIAQNPDNAPPTSVTLDADGGLRADPGGHPAPSNLGAKPGQLGAAIAAAHSIVGLNDEMNTPAPAILVQLMGLKAHYRWINTFEAQPIGPGRFRFFMIASRTRVGDAYLVDLPGPIPTGSSVHVGPEGSTHRPPTPPGNEPPVIRRRTGPGRPDEPGPPPPRESTAEIEPRRRGFTDEEIAADFDEVTLGNGRMRPIGRSQNSRIPDFPRRGERDTTRSMRGEASNAFGTANEQFFTRYLDEGIGEGAERFDNIATQVNIRPIIDYQDGNPVYADYYVIADNVARDRATGGLQILDAKTTRRAPLSRNQRTGYPLIAANGGRIESHGLPRGLGHMTELGPTPVSRAIPTTDLRDLPPGTRPQYEFLPVEPSGGVGGPRVVPVTPPPHPAMPERVPGTPPAAAARETGESVGEEVVRTPPIVPARPPEPVGEGSLRAADEPEFPTLRDTAAKAAQLPEALAAARLIVAQGDAIDVPAPVILGQLMLLKRRYRWIETFRADPTGPTSWRFVLIASSIAIGDVDVGDRLELFHGSSGRREHLEKLRTDMMEGRNFTTYMDIDDLGDGFYLFESRAAALAYVKEGGPIIRVTIPRPNPADITDISLQGFDLPEGVPGAQRAEFMRWVRRELPIATRRDIIEHQNLFSPEDVPLTDKQIKDALAGDRQALKGEITANAREQGSLFSPSVARGQLFAGTVPRYSRLVRGADVLGFEYDIVQWRIREPTPEMRQQIVREIDQFFRLLGGS